MTMTLTTLTSWRVFAIALLICAAANVAPAQTVPTPQFQSATLTGSGNTITASRVPVLLSNSVIVYVDLTMQLSSDGNGNLTVASVQSPPSPVLITGNFVPGTYLGPPNLFNGKGLITVSGPSVSTGGSTAWSLAAAPGADPTLYFTSANWYVGQISNNPFAVRLNAAKITSTAYSYGIASTIPGTPDPWTSIGGTLIGAVQTDAMTLSISCLSYGGASDQASPYATITFKKQP
jgi:hypothetical protein